MRNVLSILALSLCVTACIYPYTPDLEEAPEGILAVDANIVIGDYSTVRLGTLLSLWPSDDYTPANLSGAKVWLEDDAGETYPGVPNGPYYGSGDSEYTTNDSYYGYFDASSPTFEIQTKTAPADRSYRLCIEALNAKYTSDWTALAEPPVIEDIQFIADDATVTVGVSLNGGPSATGYALLSFDETWEFHVDYIPSFSVNYVPGYGVVSISETAPDPSRYWCWKTQDNHLTYPVDYTSMTTEGVTAWPLQRFARNDSRNHRRYTINVKARTISPETYRFLKNLEDTSSGGDNLFTPTPGEISGNLHCESDPGRMVLGYALFSRCVSKRAWMDGRYLKGRQNYYTLMWLTREYYDMYYEAGYRPLEYTEIPREGEGNYGWGPAQCFDCVAAGGTLTRPDFWED